MNPTHIGAVTGANKGIGLAIVRNLALDYPKSALGTGGGSLLIYLTARDQSRGEEALKQIYSDPQLTRQKILDNADGGVSVKYHRLDIADQGSIDGFAAFLKETHPDGIDFLINNAGIALSGFDSNVVEQTLHLNYYGTLSMSEKILPLIKDTGRLVNVASMVGKIGKYSPKIRTQFLQAKSTADVTALMEKFQQDVAAGRETQEGWTSAAYAASKAGVIGMTIALAQEEQRKGSKKLVNACCPGWVKTDMTKGGGVKTPDQGAQTPVLLALGDIQGQTGLFWQSERPIER